jgi:AraC-like DNA-binding protein
MLRSRSYPPSAELNGIVARHYVFAVDLPDDYQMIDRVMAETAFVRIPLVGRWEVEQTPGVWTKGNFATFFGANASVMGVRNTGPFFVVGIAFCPAGWRVLFDEPASAYTDRMVPLDIAFGSDAAAITAIAASARAEGSEADDAEVIGRIEAVLLTRAERNGRSNVDRDIAAFERIARNNSVIAIADAAAQIGISPRQLERKCLSAFGVSPKTVLRRSRFLDMAAAMRGLSAPSDEELAALRFYDQSHLNREFQRWCGMTPGQFAATPTPLLTAGLELRQMRKVEDTPPVQRVPELAWARP